MYGLLGEKLTHSYSPAIHSMLGDYNYVLFEKNENEIEAFLKSGEFEGLNVTIPYKKTVMKYLDALDESAEKVGSVNTVAKKDGKLVGYNTDYDGFLYLVKKSGIDFCGKKVLILGTGGASLAIKAVCEDLKAENIVFISRSGENNYLNIEKHSDADIIVNTTPVGMYPKNGVSPVKLTTFTKLSAVYDIIYNPQKTKLIFEAEKLGIPAFSGLLMLVYQAVRASEIFTGKAISEEKANSVFNLVSTNMKNIVLIGMAGCGKSSVGSALAQKLNRDFIDTDEEIKKRVKRTPAEIITADGEKIFRETETAILADCCKLSSHIIATGGGVVTVSENYELIKQNSIVVFINRDIDLLPTDNRPLSQLNGKAELFRKRLPLYRSFCDIEVDGNGTVSEVAKRIEEVLHL